MYKPTYTTNANTFNVPEKLALVKLIYTIIIADRVIHKKEINNFTDLSHRLNFNLSFIQKAKLMDIDQSIAILDEMGKDKKEIVGTLLKEMALDNGFVDDQELAFLLDICDSLGIDAAFV